MFVQIIQGKTSDATGLRRQLEHWDQQLKAGAVGYCGTTSGVAEDSTFVGLVRFESEEAARRNSQRPEQGQWWAETQGYFDSEVTFHDGNEVDTLLSGGSDDAGFVQVIQGRARDKARLKQLGDEILEWFPAIRPDYVGGVIAWEGAHFIEVAYFTSEEAARRGEQQVGESDKAGQFRQWMDQVDDLTYIDLKDPWLFS